MDLMKTLLIYMSAMMTLAVQNTAAPKVTPVPTPAPQAIVETGEIPAADVTITAVPPDQLNQNGTKYTPAPVPTITPNTKAYHNLGMGAKGKEVKKLQEKLIEMGYLPEGAADGAYGRQTYNAVKKFQYYNGLAADGVAGRKTQTNLFENPDIVRNPEAEPTEAPATEAPEVTEAPETEAPATEAPEETETPEVTEAPATEAPPTEAPATEEPKTEKEPEPTEAPEATEAPEVTEAPEMTPVPADYEDDTSVVFENVDLDADVYEPIIAMVALNEGDGPLEFIKTEDGVPVMAQPRLSQNGAKIRVSLDDLCDCVESWRITDDGVGSVVLEAAGYTLALYNEDAGCSATVDGTEIPMKEDDFDFVTEGHFINAEFLASALKGEAIWDQEENTLILRILDKEAAEAGE